MGGRCKTVTPGECADRAGSRIQGSALGKRNPGAKCARGQAHEVGDDVGRQPGREPHDPVLHAKLFPLQAHDADVVAAVDLQLCNRLIELAMARAQLVEPLLHLLDVGGVENDVAQP